MYELEVNHATTLFNKTKKPVKAYLANQLGFAEIFNDLLSDFKDSIEELGIKVYEPFAEAGKAFSDDFLNIDNTDDYFTKLKLWESLSSKIGLLNTQLMSDSDCMIALLDGAHSIDDGVAGEIGYYAGVRRGPIFALRSDFRLAENPSASINLQIHEFIKLSGGELVDKLTYGNKCITKFYELLRNWRDSVIQ